MGFFPLLLILICCSSSTDGNLISLRTVSWPRQGYPEAEPCRVWDAEWCTRSLQVGRCWWRCREHPSISESCWTAGSVVGPGHLWLVYPVEICPDWNPSAVAIPEGSSEKAQSVFIYPPHKCIHLHALPIFPTQNRFHLFSLLCSNCFYTVSNAPQVPSIHNCCCLVKCFP